MSARHMSDGIRHREYRQTKRQRNADETDSKRWEGGGQYRAATATQHEP